MPAVGDHYRPTADAAHADATHADTADAVVAHADGEHAVYRVVGTSDGVALLRVTDGDGRREVTGELVRVTDLSGFELARDPDAGVHPVRELRNLLTGLYWNVRRFL